MIAKIIVFLTCLIYSSSGCSNYVQFYSDYDGSVYGLLKIYPGLIQKIVVELELSVAAIINGVSFRNFYVLNDILKRY